VSRVALPRPGPRRLMASWRSCADRREFRCREKTYELQSEGSIPKRATVAYSNNRGGTGGTAMWDTSFGGL
jgi:hypothetical protein